MALIPFPQILLRFLIMLLTHLPRHQTIRIDVWVALLTYDHKMQDKNSVKNQI